MQAHENIPGNPPESPLQENNRAYLQSAPSGTNNISIKETHTAIGIRGTVGEDPIARFDVAVISFFCLFNIGLLLPTVLVFLPDSLRVIMTVLIAAIAIITASFCQFGREESRWVVAVAFVATIAGTSINLILWINP